MTIIPPSRNTLDYLYDVVIVDDIRALEDALTVKNSSSKMEPQTLPEVPGRSKYDYYS